VGLNSRKEKHIKKIFAAGLLAVSVGVASADSVLVEGNYATSAACQADGAAGGAVAGDWTHFSCDQHDDGLWYLTLSN
jgi:hypothetical protein